MTNIELAVQFFLQIAVILLFCQVVGAVARRLGQPEVVAEMIAGVMLGPSLLGLPFPDLAAMLFPAESMRVLFPVSQLGLATYMFVVGLEFRLDIVGTVALGAGAIDDAAAQSILGFRRGVRQVEDQAKRYNPSVVK